MDTSELYCSCLACQEDGAVRILIGAWRPLSSPVSVVWLLQFGLAPSLAFPAYKGKNKVLAPRIHLLSQ